MKEFNVGYTDGFKSVLQRSGGSLVFSVYQAGKLILLSADEQRLTLRPITYPKPMGISVDGDSMAIATKSEVHVYHHSESLANKVEFKGQNYSKLYLPRLSYHTGLLDTHDVRFLDDEIVAVNTRFSCISSFDREYNFKPKWKPHFISELEPSDKCHLNGLATEDGKMRYVTALGQGDTAQSWRKNIASGGILMSVPENKILIDGIGMPHSPKIVGNYIYLLESASGTLLRIDRSTLSVERVLQLDGLTRGLSIVGNTAFIGISKIRKKSTTFSKLDDRVHADNASITAVDLNSGMILGQLFFKSIIEEIYDIDFIESKHVGIVGTYDERQYAMISTPEGVFWKKNKEKD